MPASLRLVALVIAAEILSMAGFSAFAATLPQLVELWQLTSTQAGWIGGAYFLGYVLAVPLLVGLTDRVDARVIYLSGIALAAFAGIGFSWLADGFWSALILRLLAGAALAGTYMPGLKIISERLSEAARLRAVPYYTASFGIGVSLSYLLTGWVDQALGWRTAFLAGGLCALMAGLLMPLATIGLPRQRPDNRPETQRHPLDFRPVLRNRAALAYIAAYFGHNWELFAMRAWLVAFLVFAWERHMSGEIGNVPSNWATILALVGVPASIVGAEYARRLGRNRSARLYALSSVGAGCLVALTAGLSPSVVLFFLAIHHLAISADSGTITTGALAAARPGEEGATLAVHSVIGFMGGVIGPVAVGLLIDLGGGLDSLIAWQMAFVAMALGSLAAAMAVTLLDSERTRKQDSP